MKPVAIVGAGITGLTAAFRLAEDNIPVIVYEASGHVGGVIRTHREDGLRSHFSEREAQLGSF